MQKASLKKNGFYRKLTKQQLAFLSILAYESLYLAYTYFVADPISLHLEADGFLDSEITPLIVIFSIFLVPILEELICRSYLNRKIQHLWVFPLCLGFYGLIFSFSYPTISILLGVLILLTLAIRFFLPFNKIKLALKSNFSFFFYFSSFLFAFAHIPAIHSENVSLSFFTKLTVVMVSLFPMAIILGHIRVLFGLRYSILLHCINNGSILIINGMVYS